MILYDDNSEKMEATYDDVNDIASNYNITIPPQVWELMPMERAYRIIENDSVCAIRLDYIAAEKRVTVYISLTSQYALHEMFAGLPDKYIVGETTVKASPDNYLYFFENGAPYYLYCRKLPEDTIQAMLNELIN